jgi:hypothetical protein
VVFTGRSLIIPPRGRFAANVPNQRARGRQHTGRHLGPLLSSAKCSDLGAHKGGACGPAAVGQWYGCTTTLTFSFSSRLRSTADGPVPAEHREKVRKARKALLEAQRRKRQKQRMQRFAAWEVNFEDVKQQLLSIASRVRAADFHICCVPSRSVGFTEDIYVCLR